MSTLYSSFNAGIAGLNANSTRLAAISDNIANTGTLGYKRVVASFQSMVMGGSHYGPYIAGGVRASTIRLIDERGAITASANATDLAVSGRGFLPVTAQSALNRSGNLPLMLTTTGSFRPNADGLLENPAGLILLGWPADPDGSIPAFPRDTIGGLEPIRINSNQFASDPTTRINVRVNLPATGTRADSDGRSHDVALEYYSPLGTTDTLTMTFAPTVPATGQSNEWTATVTDPSTGTVIGEYTITFDDQPPNGGRILSVTTGGAGGAYDPLTGEFTVTTDSGQDIALNIGMLGDEDSITQMADSFIPVSTDRDGSPVQSLVGVQVDATGYVKAYYDSGLIRTIAQIPLVDVPNPNGLMALDNQAYRVAPESGAMFLWNAGDGPTGEINGFSREESATDVAAELTNMIQTQRAYSSNAKVIQTVDEMLQETANLKR
ncbi:flagellar hook protein FlgE [Pararhodobacter aggregans]|uniref:Flagellar hook protein FlgE n=1 Tax=Pararhodobacter aggregans TaxID=404875 RepID=A0A2T7UTQ3_9RHOB|nr:flagellar hook-basal body complex protein [Pararhodobacter aggregans]PTX02728.1 flagellar hook protein FlgE [Pararhodobacter aggregans]PVE47959.1 flagellar biosynthesis protein FlgE [Pararhodobacter aggregans]